MIIRLSTYTDHIMLRGWGCRIFVVFVVFVLLGLNMFIKIFFIRRLIVTIFTFKTTHSQMGVFGEIGCIVLNV